MRIPRVRRAPREGEAVSNTPLVPAKAGTQSQDWNARFPPSLTLRRTESEPVEALAKTGRGHERVIVHRSPFAFHTLVPKSQRRCSRLRLV